MWGVQDWGSHIGKAKLLTRRGAKALLGVQRAEGLPAIFDTLGACWVPLRAEFQHAVLLENALGLA